ncbi:MAG: hypothetical protein JXA22_00875 [Candidatus Thermoplasmatota archaeon]|nr:hypothetical protein [Candidatus Thermoplasmatota archaeon]
MRSSMEHSKLRRIGNGQGILLSRSICNLMGVCIGASFRIDIENDRLVLVPEEEC